MLSFETMGEETMGIDHNAGRGPGDEDPVGGSSTHVGTDFVVDVLEAF